jgi:hypothetical protein
VYGTLEGSVQSAFFGNVKLFDSDVSGGNVQKRSASPSRNLFLFGCLKGEMAGFTANSPVDILSEIRRIFQKMSKETLVTVYDE